jgi:hypothetical protein
VNASTAAPLGPDNADMRELDKRRHGWIVLRLSSLLVALMAWTFALATQAANPQPSALPQVQIVSVAEGDDPAWAQPEFDDRAWAQQHWQQLDPQGRLLWMRARIALSPEARAAARPLAIQVAALAAYEVYWNGQRIGASGVPGASAAEEQPGLMDSQFYLPPALLREHNVLALRLSSHHARRRLATPMHWLALAEYALLDASLLRHHTPTLAAAGALLLGAVYFAALFLFGPRERSSLLLCLLSMAVLSQLVLEVWRSLWPYAYPLHILRLEAVLLAAAASGVLLAAYAADRYAPRLRLWLPGLSAALMLAAAAWMPGFDGKTALAILIGLSAVVIAAAVGIHARRSGAWVTAALSLGFILLLSYRPFGFVDRDYYLAAGGFVLYLFVQQVLALRRTQRARAEAELRSARLELELLKRQIQPHFLLNSLTALSEWVETDPATGVRMIEALAGELRALASISGRPRVRLAEELELCRQHLAVMSYRQDCRFELECSGVNPDQLLPPAVLHCLVENALTHNPKARDLCLRLIGERRGDDCVLRLYSPHAQGPLANSMTAADTSARGRGHAYVRARLQEAFGADWAFSSEREGEHWVDTLQLPGCTDARTDR